MQDPLTISSVISDSAAAWLSVTEKTVDANKLGVYTVTADPGALTPGVYAANITVAAADPSVKSATVPVRLQVLSPVSAGDVGFIYVLLVDPDTLETVAEADVPFNAGTAQYRYTFSGVPAGTYRIYAGTDANNDSFIGDPGEAIGAYRTVDQPTPVEIPGTNTELDFGVGYDVALPSQLSTQALSRIPVLERSCHAKTHHEVGGETRCPNFCRIYCINVKRLSKITDVDQPKGIFKDYRNAGDFIRQITKAPYL